MSGRKTGQKSSKRLKGSTRRPTAGRRQSPGALSHIDARGRIQMVDVGEKTPTLRTAVARGRIRVGSRVMRLIQSGEIVKGDPLQAARIAGIMAAKRTAELIPLCHQIPLSLVEVDLRPRAGGYDIETRVQTNARTGVEMEALTAVSAALLTIYDMVKAVDRTMVIGDIRLVEKTGGRSGPYRAT